MLSVGVDVGIVRLGVGVFDGARLRFGRMNFTQFDDGAGGGLKVALTPARFTAAAARFVDLLASTFDNAKEVGIEVQMRSRMEQFAQALAGVIQGRYPRIQVTHEQPVSVRAFFNIRLLDKTLAEATKYPLRKQLSMAVLPKLVAPEDAARVLRAFDGEPDAIEAALIAVKIRSAPTKKRKAVARAVAAAPAYLEVAAPIAFDDALKLRLTEAERARVLSAPVKPKRKPAAAKKPRKKKIKAAPASP